MKKQPKFPVASVVGFEEPPPRRERRYDWDKIATQLRKKPNEWAKVFVGDKSSLVVAIRAGNIKAMRPSRGIEVRTTDNVRPSPDSAPGEVRRCTLWARYVPEKDTEETA